MNRKDWKNVLSSLSNDELIEMIGIWDLKVKGFRNINKDNIKVVRKMAINEALKIKKLNLIKSFYNMIGEGERSDENSNEKCIRDFTLSELMESYWNGKELHILLGVLFSSEEEEHHLLAKKFIEKLLNESNLESIEDFIIQEEADEDSDNQSTNSTADIEKMYEKVEAKNNKLQKQISDWEQQYTKLKKEYKEEKQAWIKEKAQLQQVIGNEKSNLEKEIKEYIHITEEKEKLEEEVKTLKAEVAHLHARLLNYNNEVAATVSDTKTNEPILHVLMIGDPKNKIIESSNNPKLSILDPNNAIDKIEDFDFGEIWILEYLVSPSVKKRIIKKYKEKVKSFKDFTSVKICLEKGRL
ncbi:uncharacterized protein YlxW (UPF0749 family) [Salirhabdus euzebyi]|uniref:Uncharacterized protein YlxW (UPF0749 family) n=1 Tax=Salirhabdus euzebyi TaxID=394506 RepID=A0A841Q1G6_9BACI|nr:hypothetical protein [Salirhabdus euzebyi]MBB6451605.1 uncharacterized protein YlxW (UPF0749 family) [Salirhabdus euzebyi]